MRLRHLVTALAFLLLLATSAMAPSLPADASAALAQELDAEVPPGNPVIGDDRPGDIENDSDTNYVLWAVVAVCLIGAGVLLVKVERWEARRVSG